MKSLYYFLMRITQILIQESVKKKKKITHLLYSLQSPWMHEVGDKSIQDRFPDGLGCEVLQLVDLRFSLEVG